MLVYAPYRGIIIMGLIKNYDYIEHLGFDKVLHATNLGNTLYLLNNGKKYKEFSADYRDLTDSVNISFKQELERQTEYYSDTLISFPEIVIANEQELFGIISDFEIGEPLTKIDPLTQIEHLLYIIEYLEKGIINITEKGWNLEDLHEENILINLNSQDKPVRIIDTDFYCFQNERDKLELYRQNMRKIFFSIIYSIIPSLSASNIWQDNEIQEKYHLAANGFLKCSEFLKFLLIKLKFNFQKERNIQTLQKTL